MEPAFIPIFIFIIILILFVWGVFLSEWDLTDLIVRIRPFSAKHMQKRDAKQVRKNLKKKIIEERNRLREEIETTTEYCELLIIYKENINWLKKKGFKVTEVEEKAVYRIDWSNTKNDSQS